MNAPEYSELFSKLREILIQNRLSWIVDQVEEQLREGKHKTESIKTYKEKEDNRQRILNALVKIEKDDLEVSKRENIVVVGDYTPRECLLLLINSIQHAIVNTADIELETLLFFQNSASTLSGNIPKVLFYPDNDSSFGYVEFSLESAKLRKLNAEQLSQLLTRMRNLI
jgi:hypothetical protein